MQQQVADIERDLQQQMAEETAEHAAKIVSTHVSLQVISLCQPTPAKEPSPLPERRPPPQELLGEVNKSQSRGAEGTNVMIYEYV